MLKIKHLNLNFLNQCKYYDNNQKVFCTYDNYWNNWTIRGLKVRIKPYFIGFTTKYAEPCFHIPVIVPGTTFIFIQFYKQTFKSKIFKGQ